MELYLNATSPYARLVRIVLLEKGLADTVTLKWCDPWADDAELLKANPAGRIPALVTEEGTTLSESMLIAVYLDSVSPNPPMLPAASRGDVLHLAGLGQNLMDAAFTTVIARKHYGNEIDESELGQRRSRAIQRLLKQLNNELGEKQQASNVNLGEIAIAVALDYLAFRLPEVNWKEEYPRLLAWHAGVTARGSFQETAFV
ncbi:glutathione S-transferase N-terminal domain-containing protein [Halomonas aquamarina]|jgi:glutathione S-transferase|uniref:Glutathione S-transferase n=1 Tax=Halomonas johnsoniae TaxID=502832 RepID=A0ABQ2WHP7_9GAMM|nr:MULTISPECIES: glutathione S-transferase N-terminal domain-containing protein [Oceanospirillales]KTG25144.1 glutathione S-transferase [Idiomarina sp. H105]MEC9305381.1 glutathione S-transferase N-terminal domain-containing protein [Pseudomonadota bacterium]OAE94742.1 glutathione S-transferase [Idiomarina sp. WRN-38]KJD20238.1 glutathione S-transferase [Halomonas meridiana]MBU86343.1 glutathione S-transferase [Alcanivorax sp.]|tara:strand:+ start:1207 stop:1809 length:603 start_codon:yes stop_codon:yes gene_type:complete